MLRLVRPAQATHEDLFVERYLRLRDWALRITRHDRPAAEDLLHDAFVHFSLAKPELNAIENLDSYFYGMLRNLYLARMRRIARSPFVPLPVADYDSAAVALRLTDPRMRLQASEELRMVCVYVCACHDTNLTACVLALRFFHGYYPAEIARLLGRSRGAVDGLLHSARDEARRWLDRPPPELERALSSVPAPSIAIRNDDEQLVRWLQDAIVRTPSGSCAPREVSRRRLQDGPSSIELAVAAHMVSCRACLDAATARAGLPSLASRSGVDHAGRSAPPRGKGTGGGTDSGDGHLEESKRRARDVFEHRPKELRIIANGFEVGVLQVASAQSSLDLSVTLDEPVDTVEIVSSQGLRLLWRDVQLPPAGAVLQPAHVDLSDNRSLDVVVDFSRPWPNVHLSYVDPLNEPQPIVREGAVASHESESYDRRHSWFDRWWFGARWSFGVAMVVIGTLLTIALGPSRVFAAVERIGRTVIGVVREFVAPTRSLLPSRAIEPFSARPGQGGGPRFAIAHSAPPTLRPVLPIDTVRLEVDVLARVSRAGLLLGRQVVVSRDARSETVEIRTIGVTPTLRKTIADVLADLGRERWSRVVFRSDMGIRPSVPPSHASARLRDVAIDRGPIAADAELRRFLASRHPDANLDEAVGEWTNRIVDRSRQALLEAGAVRDALATFSADELHAMDRATLQQFSRLIQEHAGAVQRHTALLRFDLQAVFGVAAVADALVPMAAADADPVTKASRLFALATQNDAGVRAAFALSGGHETLDAFSTGDVWRTLREAEDLATRLGNDF